MAAGADVTFLRQTGPGDRLAATAVRRVRSGRTGLCDVQVLDDAGAVVAEVLGQSVTTDRPSPL